MTKFDIFDGLLISMVYLLQQIKFYAVEKLVFAPYPQGASSDNGAVLWAFGSVIQHTLF